MAEVYSKTYEVRWADLDPNGHMRHSAYADYGAQTRVSFLEDHGFGIAEFQKHRLGPVLFREDTKFMREIRPNERIRVTVEATGLSPNKKHFKLRHKIYRQDGELASVIDCQGAWFDLVQRKVIPAPPGLQAAMDKMARAQDYEEFTPQK